MKPPFWLTVFSLLAFLILVGLGLWQVKRLNWKQEILADLTAARQKLDNDKTSLPGWAALENFDSRFRAVDLPGTLHPAEMIPIGPRSFQGAIGKHIYLPLVSPDKTVIWVFYGFAPDDGIPLAAQAEEVQARIRGLARRTPQPNLFTPENEPATDTFYWPVPGEMSRASGMTDAGGYTTLPLILNWHGEKIAEPPVPAGLSDLRTSVQPDVIAYTPRNKHLQYALFWFTMAGIVIIFWALISFRKNTRA